MLRWFKVNQMTGLWLLQIVNLEKIFAGLFFFSGRKFYKTIREIKYLNSDLHLDNTAKTLF